MALSAPENQVMQELGHAQTAKQPCLLFFHAEWCGACQHTKKNLMAGIEQVCAQQNVRVVHVDVDQTPRISSATGVSAMPTFQLWRPDAGTGRLAVDHKKDVIVGADDAQVKALVGKKR